MRCPACQAWTELLETRKRSSGTARRYECANWHRFTTLDHELVRIDIKKLGAGRPSKKENNQ